MGVMTPCACYLSRTLRDDPEPATKDGRMATIEDELRERIARLPPDQKRRVLEYARSLDESTVRGVPGETLLRFAGVMSEAEAREIAREIEEGCETVDARDW